MHPIIEIFGITLYSYPLIMGMAWAFAYILSNELNNTQKEPIPKFNFLYALFLCSSFLGAKFAYIFSSNKAAETYFYASFWLGGGFVFYGGLLLSFVSLIFYKMKFNIEWNRFNFLIPTLCFSHAIGRLGCLLAGCCYGKPTDLMLSIHLHGMDRHPVQIYEFFFLICLGGVFLYQFLKGRQHLFLQYLVYYSGGRFVLEFLRGDLIRGLYWGLSFSQYIALIILVIGSLAIVLKGKALRI